MKRLALTPSLPQPVKVSGLKSAQMPENSYIFKPTFNNSTFNIVRFDINLLHLKARERKGLKISNFTLLSFIFN